MHELSIAESILDIAAAEAATHHAAAVTTIKVRLGNFTGVVREALEFAFEIARQGTVAASATLEIESVPLRTRCPSCDMTGSSDFCFICERCGTPLDILSGREMQVESIELAEEEVPWIASR
ncbi:MAG: hydrogenase maturation nickel metallochaperone HypA [Acidobacteriia bacterium]|nr:hydrogenase maturation nickel metallochaperone HypA [Terriglobia bacterium]